MTRVRVIVAWVAFAGAGLCLLGAATLLAELQDGSDPTSQAHQARRLDQTRLAFRPCNHATSDGSCAAASRGATARKVTPPARPG